MLDSEARLGHELDIEDEENVRETKCNRLWIIY